MTSIVANTFSLVAALLLLPGTARAATHAWVWNDVSGLQPSSSCSAPVLSEAPQELERFLSQVIEITDEPQSTVQPFQFIGSFWQAAGAGGKFYQTTCAGKTYSLFDVYRAGRQQPVARVGVTPAEIALFQYSTARPIHEAAATAASATATAQVLNTGMNLGEGNFELVACAEALAVRDTSLKRILFSAGPFETVKLVQSFENDSHVNYVRVQFPEHEAMGWVPENAVRLRSECAGANTRPSLIQQPQLTAAWTFPVLSRPAANYKTDQRMFRAARAGGRLHAACDLYRTTGEQALAVSSGQVIRDRYYFYEGTYAIEVRHSDGKVVRYGEITGKAAPSIKLNSNVATGQTVGYVGKVNSGCCTPMLHFEMYSGRASGPLTQGSTGFQRRSDLIDPSSYLTTWEKAKFGKNW